MVSVSSILIPLASFNERLLLGNGLCISPIKNQSDGLAQRSLRDVVFQIDNTRDFNDYVSSFVSKVGNAADIRYERHPVRYRPKSAEDETELTLRRL